MGAGKLVAGPFENVDEVDAIQFSTHSKKLCSQVVGGHVSRGLVCPVTEIKGEERRGFQAEPLKDAHSCYWPTSLNRF